MLCIHIESLLFGKRKKKKGKTKEKKNPNNPLNSGIHISPRLKATFSLSTGVFFHSNCWAILI